MGLCSPLDALGSAQTLTADETYAITAYILYSNYLVEDDFVLSKDNFLEVEMPNADGFIVDDREEAEAHFWNDDACMSNCKDSVEITMRAAVLDVTPEETRPPPSPPQTRCKWPPRTAQARGRGTGSGRNCRAGP